MGPPQFGMAQGQDRDKGSPSCGKITRENSVGGAGISRHHPHPSGLRAAEKPSESRAELDECFTVDKKRGNM